MVRRRRYSKEGKILFRLFIRRQLFQQTLAAIKYIFYWNIFLSCRTKMLNWQLQGKKSSWRWWISSRHGSSRDECSTARMNVQQQGWMFYTVQMFSSWKECSALYQCSHCSAAGMNVLHSTNVQQQEWMFNSRNECSALYKCPAAGMNVLHCTNVQQL